MNLLQIAGRVSPSGEYPKRTLREREARDRGCGRKFLREMVSGLEITPDQLS